MLNRPEYRSGTVLVAGRNFACGSSREHAVWALADQGFRAVIAPSFADIFRNNAVKCGLLPVVLPEAQVRQLLDVATEDPGVVGIVDLEEQTVAVGDLSFRFEIDPFERRCLLDGLDDIGLSLIHEPAIGVFEARRPAWMPEPHGRGGGRVMGAHVVSLPGRRGRARGHRGRPRGARRDLRREPGSSSRSRSS